MIVRRMSISKTHWLTIPLKGKSVQDLRGEYVFHCPNCNKEIIIMAISHGAIDEERLSQLIESFEKGGKLVLLNPPPHSPYKCPICATELVKLKNNSTKFSHPSSQHL